MLAAHSLAMEETWRVILASGEARMTLDELDAAFDAGRVDASTLVCRPGARAFARLGAEAGLDEAAPRGESPVADADDVDVADLAALRPRWSFRRMLLIPAALTAIGLIAFAVRAGTASETSPSPAAALEVPTVVAPPPAAPAPPAVTVALTEDQKNALAAKDKKSEVSRRKATKAIAAPRRAAGGKSAAPFSKGGNKHDPLNGAL